MHITRRGAIIGAATFVAAPGFADADAVAKVPEIHEVRINSFAFSPARLNVRVGDTIRWINEDLAPHTATANEFGWDTGEILTNQSVDILVQKDMELAYFCVFHPHMKGTLTI